MNKQQRAAQISKMKALLNQGLTVEEIANELQISIPTVYRHVSKEKKHIKQAYKEALYNIEIPELRGMKDIFETPHSPTDLSVQGYSVYDYSAENIGKNAVRTEEEGFSRAMLNIPYIGFSPAKRIQQLCRSIYEWRSESKAKGNIMCAYRRFTQIEKPDIPLYINHVKYHDCDTLNAVIDIAETEADKHFTSLDACIISRAFADRFVITRTIKQTLFTKQWDIAVDTEVKQGVIYEDMINPVLTKRNEIKLSGKIIRILSVKETIVSGEKVKINVVLIESRHKLSIGDKLRSMTGLKVVVGDVREQVPDIVVNMNQILSKTSVKGALVKEILSYGKVAVGMRNDEILGVDESLYWGSSISITLYPVLKVYDPVLLKRLISENFNVTTFVQQLLLSLHLDINPNTGIIEIIPESHINTEDEHYTEASHYLWNYDNKIRQQHKEFEQIYVDKTSALKNIKMAQFVWDTLYIPDFILPFYISGGKPREAEYLKYIGKTWEQRADTPGKGKHPFLVKVRGEKGTTYSKILKTCLFPKIRKGKYLKAIPQIKDKWELEVGIKDFNEKGYLTIFREPALDEFSVWCLPVKYNPDLPKYCIRVPLEVMLAANGDTDGDSICVIPYKSEYFRHVNTTLPKIDLIDKSDLGDIVIPYNTNEKILDKGRKHMKGNKIREKAVRDFGGLRNRIALELEDMSGHKKLLDYAIELEALMKGERAKSATAMKTVKQKMKALFPETLRYDKGESSYIVLMSKHGKHGVIDINNLLGFNTRVSKFWCDLWG